MSDFYIFLEYNKKLTYEEIENLSDDELHEYVIEYLKEEKNEGEMN